MMAQAVRLLGFAALAIVTNTAFPYPFEPVLLVFAEGAGPRAIVLLSGTASVAAGVAALIDYHLLGALRNKLFAKGARDLHRWWFYAGVFATALLPIPYTVTRAALLRGRPNPLLFAATVTLARFPRYVLTIRLWHLVAPPAWILAALVVLGILMAVHMLRKRRRSTTRTNYAIAPV
jgi:membrane protein YqaA with SNARE-associated domain